MRRIESRLNRLETKALARVPPQFIGRDFDVPPQGYESPKGEFIYRHDDEPEVEFYKRLYQHASILPPAILPVYWGVDKNGKPNGW